jgi:hypothetical protein
MHAKSSLPKKARNPIVAVLLPAAAAALPLCLVEMEEVRDRREKRGTGRFVWVTA